MLIMEYNLESFDEGEVRYTTSRCGMEDAIVVLHVEKDYKFEKLMSTLEALSFWFGKEVMVIHEGEPHVYVY